MLSASDRNSFFLFRSARLVRASSVSKARKHVAVIPTAGTINAIHQCSRSDDNTSASEGITGTFFILRLGTNRTSVAPDCAKITEVDARARRLDSATDLPTCSSKRMHDQ
jgi:hypothetical protein